MADAARQLRHQLRVAAGITTANIDGRQVLVAVGGAIWQNFELLGSRRTTEVYDLATGLLGRSSVPNSRYCEAPLGARRRPTEPCWPSAAVRPPARSPRSWPSSSPAWTWPANEPPRRWT